MRNALTLWCTSLLVLGQLIGCDERGPTVDAAMDGRPPADKAWEDAASEPPEDWNAPDAEVDARADGTADRRDTATPDADVAVDEEGGADVRDTSVDDGEASSVVFLDRPAPMDGLIEGVDVTTPDEGAVAFDVGDGCSVPRFGAPYDAGPPCSPGRTRACTCSGGRLGAERCESTGLWDPCVCVSTDAGVAVVDGEVIVPERPIPWIGRPRLLAPQSGMRVTSQRPTLRWMLPSGIERARVELCADRPCARMLAQQEVRGDRWRPTTALAAGVVFWRVRGLDATGAVRWTSATWEFGVRHRDLGVDTSYGALKDFNGDGYDDLVTSQGSRGFLVYTGSSAGIAAARVLELGAYGDDGSRDLTELVEQAGIGDFNGDGLADLAFGSGAFGRAYVHLGSRACVLARAGGIYRADLFISGEEVASALSVGDFNGDGYADLLTNSARMQLYPGGPAGPSETLLDVSPLTSNFAGFVGDINGDGYQDILSMPVSPRREVSGLPLLVLYGNPEGRIDFHVERLPNPIGSELPTSLQTFFGFVLRWSDLNEDGYTDAVVSLPGRIYVYYGSPAGYTRIVRPQTTEVSFGAGLFGNFGGYTAHPVDIDGDGHAEVFTSNLFAPGDEVTRRNGPGRLYVFARDASTGLLATASALTIAAPPQSYLFGKVAAPGDLHGDGYDDLVVGALASVPAADPIELLYAYHGGHPLWWRVPAARFERAYAFNRSE